MGHIFHCVSFFFSFFIFFNILVVSGYYVACDFESNADRTCGFYNNASNNVDWALKTGDVQKSFTRPLVDHTHGTNAGRYTDKHIFDNGLSYIIVLPTTLLQ